MEATEKNTNTLSLTDVISTAIQIPGVKVNRDSFLCDTFKEVESEKRQVILDKGPVEAGLDREDLKKRAHKIIQSRTAISTSASFAAGLPGGLAMAATIPADLLQFYGVALRMAQELAYLYGEGDLWENDFVDRDKVTNQLILYCGVMLGASGAAQTVRVLSSALAKQAMKKLPQQALTKTFYYPIVKSIARWFGVSLTKTTFAKGVSKAVPIIGGVVSGSITLATMLPMGQRLADTLDDAHFGYTQEEFEEDWEDIVEIIDQEAAEEAIEETPQATENEPKVKLAVPTWLNKPKKKEKTIGNQPSLAPETAKESVLDKIQQASEMLKAGILTEQEFTDIKAKLISEM